MCDTCKAENKDPALFEKNWSYSGASVNPFAGVDPKDDLDDAYLPVSMCGPMNQQECAWATGVPRAKDDSDDDDFDPRKVR